MVSTSIGKSMLNFSKIEVASFSGLIKLIVLGVSAGISVYKAVELLRLMVKEGANVSVVMSANAGKFVTPLTFEALSGNPVYHTLFDSQNSASMEHIRVAENADLLVVAPTTASTLGKMAHGLADDALSNLHLAFKGKVLKKRWIFIQSKYVCY